MVETDTVPKTYVGPGNKRLRMPDGGDEPIGNRIIENPEDEEVVLNRDPRLGFVAFVPKGSIAKGKALAGRRRRQNDRMRDLPRADPAGARRRAADRRPSGDLCRPPVVHDPERRPLRSRPAALMQQVVKDLTVDDMLALAAYTASREP